VSTEPAEILAVDFWSTLEGLKDHYGDATAMSGLDECAHRTASGVGLGASEWVFRMVTLYPCDQSRLVDTAGKF
jgi:hypothetical protein